MTELVNDPLDFALDSLAGFASAYPARVSAVDGGVVRARPVPGKVTIVTGGGSGHFPAFAGWVGPGLCDAAVCGNVFSSPSEHQILNVTRAADQGAGVLFVPINYTGDILHFGAARERLAAEGIDARLVAVTDDIASGAADQAELRRGVAGSLIVMKVVGAAAERGWTLDEVERVAKAANAATRSFGVAFQGCTLPGADAPLFTLEPGRMSVGLGIHGEPGLYEVPIGSASAVADILVDGLFAERPPVAGQSVTVIVNGLGDTKYDELNLVFARVRARLDAEGMRIVVPEIGEYVTSLDMAGVSVSIGYLDAELEELLRDPVDSVALSRPRIEPSDELVTVSASTEDDRPRREPGSAVSQEAARAVLAGAERVASALAAAQDRLGALDAVIGDGDHGNGMFLGASAALTAVRAAVAEGDGAGGALAEAGGAWSAQAGGSSGAFWGAGLEAAGAVLGDEEAPSPDAIAAAVRAFADAILRRGGAHLGDKTMIDAIVPFAEALEQGVASGLDARGAWAAAAAAATEAADGTAALASARGRARIYGERAIGTPDPGAVSFAIVVAAAQG